MILFTIYFDFKFQSLIYPVLSKFSTALRLNIFQEIDKDVLMIFKIDEKTIPKSFFYKNPSSIHDMDMMTAIHSNSDRRNWFLLGSIITKNLCMKSFPWLEILRSFILNHLWCKPLIKIFFLVRKVQFKEK